MTDQSKNPYVGARTFEQNESDLFFGREREAQDLLSLVISDRLVLFYAQSGAGKSSLVNTRLVPGLIEEGEYKVFSIGRLRRDEVAGSTAKNVYIYNLITSLTSQRADDEDLSQLSLSEFLGCLEYDPKKKEYFYNPKPSRKLFESDAPIPWKYVLIVDQFEELFTTYEEQWEKREDFFRQLTKTLQDFPHLWVVLVMREDYIAYLDPYLYLLPGRLRTRYYMQRLEKARAIEAVEGPARRRGRTYARGAAKRLVDELSSIIVRRPDNKWESQPGQYVEPVQLQVVCSSLWEKVPEDATEITKEHVEKYVHDLNQALGNFYEDRILEVAHGRITQEKKVTERQIRRWFEKELIIDGKRRNMVAQEPGGESGGLDDDVVREFLGSLVREEKRGGGATFYELTHDRMVEPIIESNRKWDSEHSSPFRSQAEEWQRKGRKGTDDLITDQALIAAQQWAEINPDKLMDAERDYLEASWDRQKAKEEEERRQREEQQRKLDAARERAEAQERVVREKTRSARIAQVLLALALIAVGVAVWQAWVANQSSKEAELRKGEAELQANKAQIAESHANIAANEAKASADNARANELAANSKEPFLSFDRSILLSVAAFNRAPKNRAAQLALTKNFHQVQRLKNIYTMPWNPVNGYKLSPNGEILAIWNDENIRILNHVNENSTPLDIRTSNPQIYFSPDSKTLAVIDKDGIRRWNAETFAPLSDSPFNEHPGRINQLVLVSDEESFITLGEDSKVQYWDLKGLEGVPVSVESENIVISPTGEMLAAMDEDGNFELWSVMEDQKIAGPVPGSKVEFSSDSKFLATVNIDQSISVRDARTGELILEITPELDGTIDRMVFSPEASYLAISNNSQITEVWDIKEKESLSGSISGSPWLFSPNEKILFTGYDFNIDSSYCLPALDQNDVPIGGVLRAIDQDGTVMAIEQDDGIFSLWDVSADGCGLTETAGSGFTAEKIILSPDGTTLASLGSDGSIVIRDVNDGNKTVSVYKPKPYSDESSFLLSNNESGENGLMAYNGTFLAFLGDEGIHLRDVRNNKDSVLPPDDLPASPITQLTFTRDDLLIGPHQNGKITLWNVKEDQVSQLESNTKEQITDLIFDEEGEKILSISPNTVFLVDANRGTTISGPMEGRYLDVNWASNLLATLQNDKITVWDTKTGKMINNIIEESIGEFAALFSPDGEEAIREIEAYFTPDGEKLLVSLANEIALYNSLTLEKLGSVPNPFEDPFAKFDIAFSPDSKVFALAAMSQKVRLYCLDVGSEAIKAIEQPSSYSYGGFMIFADNKNSMYFNEPGNSYLDRLDWTSDCDSLTSHDKYVVSNANTPIGLDETIYALGEKNSSESLVYVHLLNVESFVGERSPKLIETININLSQSTTMPDVQFVHPKGSSTSLLAARGTDNKVYVWQVNQDLQSEQDRSVITAAMSPDGRKKATFTKDGIVLDSTDVSNPSQPFNGHTMEVNSAYFNKDGSILAATGENERTIFYDLSSSPITSKLIDGRFDETYADGDIWVTTKTNTISNEYTYTLWDPGTGEEVREISSGELLEDISSDGLYIAVSFPEASNDFGKVKLSTREGKPVQYINDEQIKEDKISGVFQAFSPDSETTYFALMDDENNTEIWKIDTSDPDELTAAIVGEPIPGTFIGFSKGGKYVAVYKPDGDSMLVETATGQQFGKQVPAESAYFSTDGRLFISRNFDYDDKGNYIPTTSLLDTETGKQIIEPFEGELIFTSPDGTILVTSYTDEAGLTKNRIWNISTGMQVDETTEYSGLIGFSQDGGTLINRNPDGTIGLQDFPATGLPPVSIEAENIVYSPDKRFAVAIHSDPDHIVIWDLNNQAILEGDLAGIDPGSIAFILFSPENAREKLLAFTGRNGIYLLDINNNKVNKLFSTLQEKSGLVKEMLFSPDNKYLATRGSDGIIVTVVGNLNLSKMISNQQAVGMAFSGEDKITYLTDDFEVYETNFVDESGGGASLGKLVNNPKSVCGFALSDDGSKAALQIGDKILLWDKIDDFISPLTEIKLSSNCNEGPSTLAFSSGGSALAVGDGGRVHIWDLEKEEGSELNISSPSSIVVRIEFIDENLLAVQSDSSTISLWSLESYLPKDETFLGDLKQLNSNAQKLYYRDPEGQVILVDLNSDDLSQFQDMRAHLCKIVSESELSEGEQQQFFPNGDYLPICANPSSMSDFPTK